LIATDLSVPHDAWQVSRVVDRARRDGGDNVAPSGRLGGEVMPALTNLRPRLTTLDTRVVKPAPKMADPFYLSPEWRALMGAIIAERGRRCEDPLHNGLHERSPRVFGDHIVELKDGGAPLDPANVLLRCGACHTRKTIAARAVRMARPSGRPAGPPHRG
jgi:5-methylcytosine-specific restriction protein A